MYYFLGHWLKFKYSTSYAIAYLMISHCSNFILSILDVAHNKLQVVRAMIYKVMIGEKMNAGFIDTVTA